MPLAPNADERIDRETIACSTYLIISKNIERIEKAKCFQVKLTGVFLFESGMQYLAQNKQTNTRNSIWLFVFFFLISREKEEDKNTQFIKDTAASHTHSHNIIISITI
jgi:hypothetical protein